MLSAHRPATRTSPLVTLVSALSVSLLLVACSSGASGDGTSTGTSSADAAASGTSTSAATETVDDVSGTLTVYAAASLKASFDEIATEMETLYPNLDVQPIVYDGSSTLVTQIVEGAPADVFAAADEKNMTKATDAGVVDGTPALFAQASILTS